ncbi:phosphoribosyltransferase family protein [Cytophaga aurantiaca]|uniref:phosphoribosyltransferase family protein n=1 Tax=Cytophaga aurantiaca TaxID=29530 RepID=UPI000365F64F|nr:phosphoribosyltransferase family protein [Cytophaga aurantiaca]
MAEKNLILNKKQIQQRIKRIAYEILEQNFKEKEIVFAGIYDRGYSFAKLLEKEFNSISDTKTTLIKVTLDKQSPSQSEVTLDVDVKTLKNKCVIIVDDVLSTGRTIAYSLKPFLNINIKRIQTAFIVDRGHHTFPISADFVGYVMATTLQEHVEVNLSAKDMGVYLS